jgi:crotonobetainyl-CoA:carnitine CoA-transferase CaiB-like acyl-CoA transferase
MGTLDGLRVVEMGVWVAGPSAAGVMADCGADVIKVEPPAGDPFRNLFGSLGYEGDYPNPPFALDNRGKRSVVLDLRNDSAREALDRIIATADVFISNLRTDALERLGLDGPSLTKRFSRLVYGSVTGYGIDGPDRDRAAYDVGGFFARSGISNLMVPPDQPPLNQRGGLGDHVTGLSAVSGILAALFARERTGRG